MLKHLRTLRQRLIERRQYHTLVAELERINAAETVATDHELAALPDHGSQSRSTQP